MSKTMLQLLVEEVPNASADADGWIKWHGGECPVPEGTLVDVKHRDGDFGYKCEAGTRTKHGGGGSALAHRWAHTGGIGDIIAYRLHQTQDINNRANDDRLAQDVVAVKSGANDNSSQLLDLLLLMGESEINISLSDSMELAQSIIAAGYKK